MKRKVFLFAILISSLSIVAFVHASHNNVTVSSSNYKDGWDDGYCEGWKDVKGSFAICPIPPIAPLPEISCGTSYKCGYNRGFKKGRADAKSTKH